MKNLLFVFAVAGLLMGFKPKPMTVKIKTSAQCESCQERIERNLSLAKGVNSASLSLTDKVVTVVYNPKKTSPDKIKEVVRKAGYDADDLPADAQGYDSLPKCCKKGGHADH